MLSHLSAPDHARHAQAREGRSALFSFPRLQLALAAAGCWLPLPLLVLVLVLVLVPLLVRVRVMVLAACCPLAAGGCRCWPLLAAASARAGRFHSPGRSTPCAHL